MEKWEIVVWVIIVVIVVWQLYAEFAFQRCYDGLDDCGEEWRWSPQEGDGVAELVQRIEVGNAASTLIIKRGLIVVGSAVIAMVVSLWYQARKGKPTRLPEVLNFVVTWAIILGLFWAVFRYYEAHYTHPASRRTQRSVQELKYQLNLEQRPVNATL